MNFNLLSSILRSTWAIDYSFAITQGETLSILLNKESTQVFSSPKPKVQTVRTSNNKTVFTDGLQPIDKNSIAVIPVNGTLLKSDTLCSIGMETIGQWIKQSDQNDNIRAIVLVIDSPGGTVDGTLQLAQIVANCQKPVISFINGLCASAAYWIA